jgi:NADPH2:quinone reductase
LGANLAVDYTAPAWTDRVRSEVGEVDVVFDGVGGAVGKEAFELLRAGGRFCMFGAASGTFTSIADEDVTRRRVTVVRGVSVAPEELVELARAALVEAAAGRLRRTIGQTFRLEDAAAAHAAIEARTTVGKTLLLVGMQPQEFATLR